MSSSATPRCHSTTWPTRQLQQLAQLLVGEATVAEEFDAHRRLQSAKDAVVNDLLKYFGPNSIFIFGNAGFGRGGFNHLTGCSAGGALKELTQHMSTRIPNRVFTVDEFR